jgi:hypothetical protein
MTLGNLSAVIFLGLSVGYWLGFRARDRLRCDRITDNAGTASVANPQQRSGS